MCSNLKNTAHNYCTRVLPGVDAMNGVVMFGIFLATPTVQVNAPSNLQQMYSKLLQMLNNLAMNVKQFENTAHDYYTRLLPGVDVMNGVVMFGIFLATPTVQVNARLSARVVV